VSSYHRDITAEMLEAAEERVREWEAALKEKVTVAGAFEIPLAAQRLARRKGIDAIVTLGFIEKGETLHGQVLGNSVASALLEVALASDKPVSFGVIGPGATHEQARKRVAKVAREAVDAVMGAKVKL
jgi:6,7-dimethyl-8-ribityllumazine synthase